MPEVGCYPKMGLPSWFDSFCLPIDASGSTGGDHRSTSGGAGGGGGGVSADAGAGAGVGGRNGSSKKKQRKLAKARRGTTRAHAAWTVAASGGGDVSDNLIECCEVTHPFKLTSMVPAMGPVKSPPTTWQTDFVDVVDYIFYTNGPLALTNRWRMRSAAALARLGGIPNGEDPSDHQIIAGQFVFSSSLKCNGADSDDDKSHAAALASVHLDTVATFDAADAERL